MSSSSSSIFTIVYCARVFFAFAETKQLPKKQAQNERKEKKEKVGSEVENRHHILARTRHTGKMSSQSVQTFGRKYVYTISS